MKLRAGVIVASAVAAAVCECAASAAPLSLEMSREIEARTPRTNTSGSIVPTNNTYGSTRPNRRRNRSIAASACGRNRGCTPSPITRTRSETPGKRAPSWRAVYSETQMMRVARWIAYVASAERYKCERSRCTERSRNARSWTVTTDGQRTANGRMKFGE